MGRGSRTVTGAGSPLVMSATWLTHLEHQWRSLAWRPWLEALSRDHTVLRYDSRGCGLSDRDVGDLSFETWVSDFDAVVDAAGFDRFSLLGVCQGGPIAIEYVARHPGRVSHLLLYGTYARGRSQRFNVPQEVEKARLLLELTGLGRGSRTTRSSRCGPRSSSPAARWSTSRSWSEQQRAATSPEMAVRLLRIGFEADVRESARRVACPTLIIHAERDAVVPIEEARVLAGLIPGSRFVQLDSENHMLLPREPAWAHSLDEARGFLPRARGGTRAARLPLSDLTPRERDVLERIAEGLEEQRGDRHGPQALPRRPCATHVTRVFEKIGAHHRYQAIVRAREAGLGTAPALPLPLTRDSRPGSTKAPAGTLASRHAVPSPLHSRQRRAPCPSS